MLKMSKTGTPFYIPTTWKTALLLSVIGLLGFVGQVRLSFCCRYLFVVQKTIQLFLAMGLQRETASRGTMALYTQVCHALAHKSRCLISTVQIVFAVILEGIVFHTLPGTISVIGACLIMGSALYVAVSAV